MWFFTFSKRGKKTFSVLSLLILFASITSYMFVIEDGDSVQLSRANESSMIVSGWTFPWDDSSWTTLKSWESGLDEVSPYWYYALENGTLINSHNNTEDRDFIVLCRSRNIEIIPMISNNHNTSIVTNIITNISVQDHHINELLYMTRSNGFEGVDINYENIPTNLKEGYSIFIQRLSQAFHSKNKKVYVSVFPKVSDTEVREGPGAYDYRSIGEHADSVRVMVYNLHWSSAPTSGPITSYEWVRTVMEYSVDAIPAHKVSLGIPLFGYDWIVDRTGRALSIADNVSFEYISGLIEDPGIEREWNGTSRTPYVTYVESNGKTHAIHYNDAESLLHEMLIARELGISRISLWRIGDEDPLVREYVGLLKSNGIQDLPPYVEIGSDRSGMKGTQIQIGPVRAYDLDGIIEDIEWDMGDGNRSHLMDATHVYSKGGSYTAVFSTTDNGGNTIVRDKNIKIGPYSFFETEGEYLVGSSIGFDAIESWDLGKIVSYNWNLGDGTYEFHAGPFIKHTYNRPGNFNITLTVINDGGYSDVFTKEIEIPDIEPPVPVAGPDISIWEDMLFIFDGRGSYDNSGSVILQWHFPGGEIKNGPVVQFSFDEPGNYLVKLVAIDSGGLFANDTLSVEVKDRTSPMISIEYPDDILLGEDISINATGSSDNVGIDNVTWKLPDGKIIFDLLDLKYHPDGAGRYYFTLDILDREGNWNSSSFHIDVLDVQDPVVEIMIDPAPALYNNTYIHKIMNGSDPFGVNEADMIFVVNVTYRFLVTEIVDESQVGYINWTFGDGDRAYGGSVYHNFSLPGRYIISLVVDDVHGNRFREDMMIVVLPTVNFTLIPVQPYENVYVNQTVEDEKPEKRYIPIIAGLISMFACILTFMILLLSEMFITVKYMRIDKNEGEDT